MAFRPHHNQAAAVALLQLGMVELAALIHHRQNFATQVEDAFQEFGRLRNPGDLVRYARHLVHGFDGQSEFVIAEAKDQEFALLAVFACSASVAAPLFAPSPIAS